MRRLKSTIAILPLALWGCNGAALPEGYGSLEVPEAQLQALEVQQQGRGLFLRHCAICHGERADGRGVRRNLSLAPRDFTDPVWQRRTTPEELFYVIREGRPGTPMAAWKTLDPDETWALVSYLMAVGDSSSD